MVALPCVACFFGGAFLANSLPHLLRGVMGQAFQSPFAKPPGVGPSSASTNVFWGAFNLLVSYFLLLRVGNFSLRATPGALALGLGALLLALNIARHFGHNGGKAPVERPQSTANS